MNGHQRRLNAGQRGTPSRRRRFWTISGVVLLLAAGPVQAQSGAEFFATPDLGAEALAAAWRTGDSAPLLRLFGRNGVALVRSGDKIEDRRARLRMAAAFDERHKVEREGADKAVLILGPDAWPYPIPLVKADGGWRFDVVAGAQQVIDRRIGRNETHAIDTLNAFVAAQRDYARRTAASGRKPEFAARVMSSEGHRDGLYWPAGIDDPESPIGPLVAAAEARGYDPPGSESLLPYRGYVFRILAGQGAHAPGGAKSYVVNGHMSEGFAIEAFPAAYGKSGIMTFVVNQTGVIFERNLGPDTRRLAGNITLFDPDRAWKVVAP